MLMTSKRSFTGQLAITHAKVRNPRLGMRTIPGVTFSDQMSTVCNDEDSDYEDFSLLGASAGGVASDVVLY